MNIGYIINHIKNHVQDESEVDEKTRELVLAYLNTLTEIGVSDNCDCEEW